MFTDKAVYYVSQCWENAGNRTSNAIAQIISFQWKNQIIMFTKSSCKLTNDVFNKVLNSLNGTVTDNVVWLRENWKSVPERLVSIDILLDMCVFVFILLLIKWLMGKYKRNIKNIGNESDDVGLYNNMFNFAKTAYEDGHTNKVKSLLEQHSLDINYALPHSGLTLFLCACISGEKDLIKYLLNKGADMSVSTSDGDSALYLATFGVLNSPHPDLSVLTELIDKGCDVNGQNKKGYTALHRAAYRGNSLVIKCLMEAGADPKMRTHTGIYPIDSATNAGHIEAAELLKVNLNDQRLVWDIVDPHTPKHIRMGLQSPYRDKQWEETLTGSASLQRKPLKKKALRIED